MRTYITFTFALIPFCLGFAISFIVAAFLGGWDASVKYTDSLDDRSNEDDTTTET